MSDVAPWYVGERVALGRREFATVDRVTPTGRAVVNKKTYAPNGRSRSRNDYGDEWKIEHVTPEIEAATIASIRRDVAHREISRVLEAATVWMNAKFGNFRRLTPPASDIEKAERLAEAIKAAMKDAE